ncbi:SUMF1/EgtB/PvdO family nonheme iron enzyme [Fischerella sp. PCC 9605]|uniref:SUMF1/EgtB/PvdO family nonheme iron enzyme n=1 Tax=Fischerella sp. PCC 9605 TaxID=1173024 RepID=UPI0004AEBC38|nr:SUMF1/EgtB/PvdO family nonheme iron enzyme [Fischerella sp. PCC 9605]
MAKGIQQKLPLWLNATLLSLSLPLLLSGSIKAQNCTQADIRVKIEQFKDAKALKAARNDVVQCGEGAVPLLANALSDSEVAIRANAADALGKMGVDAQKVAPDVVEALGDSDEAVRTNAASALIQIGRMVHKQGDTLSEWDYQAIQDLKTLKQNLEEALKRLEKDKRKWKTKEKDIQDLRLTRNALQTKLNQLTDQPLYQAIQWFGNNPWIWLAVGYLVGYFGIFIVRPTFLLQLDEWVKPATFTIPVVNLPVSLRCLLFLKYHPRVLDAWVNKRLKTAQEQFDSRPTVENRKIHIAEPFVLNGQKVDIKDFNAKALTNTFAKSQVRLVICGEGGSGKTSLACQIAKWSMAKQKDERLCQHQMLPILIEEELDQPLLETIGGLLKELTREGQPIPEELLKQLLAKRRILVIVDHLSEMSAETRKAIQPQNKEFPANALIVTSRLKDILGSEVAPSFIEPFRISVGSLASFLNRYLEKKGKAHLFDGLDYSEAYRRLERMASVRQVEQIEPNKQGITILLVKLYADQMIAAKEGEFTEDLPDNVPDLMLQYLDELNKSTQGELDNQKVHEIAEVVAWKCIEPSFKLESAGCTEVLKALESLESVAETAKENAQKHLKYLERRLSLVRVKNQTLRFSLDPLAEYLAGLYLVQNYRDDQAAWNNLIEAANDKPGFPEEIKGFLLALRDCCEVKGKQFHVPDFVAEKVGEKAGLDLEKVRQFQRQRRVRILIQELSAPEAEYRVRAATDLGTIGKDAISAIPRLHRLLENDSEVAKVRREAAKALKQLGEQIPMLTAQINNTVESIRLVEHPPTVEIDLGNQVILEMVQIPGGTFCMGAPPQEKDSDNSERPQHQVTISSFLMGKYPVTQVQWQAIASLPKVERNLDPKPSYFKGGDRPVEQVNWYDAVEFCARLSQKTGQEFRLPSEAEWEYACRAGTTTPFHFGETISSDLANYNCSYIYGSEDKGINRSETTPVGMFQVANAFGLYDMHGLVWEWCADTWHENYEGAPTDGSAWIDENQNDIQNRLMRGGSWNNNPGKCRSATRSSYGVPDARKLNIGFRVVSVVTTRMK